MESGTEAEAGCWSTVWNWGIARTFTAAIDLLSDVHDAFVFGANFSCGRSDDLPSDTAHCAASRAGFEDKTGKIIERKRPAIIDRRCDRATDRTAEKSMELLLMELFEKASLNPSKAGQRPCTPAILQQCCKIDKSFKRV